jgi:carbon-monoxide dehydrogenase large subunit
LGSILGNRVQRVEDPRMLTVGGTYVEDVAVDAAWVHFVRSEYAHGRILSYDVDDARKVPGVLGVFTGDDLDLPPVPARAADPQAGQRTPPDRQGDSAFRRRTGRRDRRGRSPHAVDAGALVYVDIEPLTAVVDLDDALSDATLVHPALETNTYASFTSEHPADFSECEVVLDLRVVNQRINGSPIEPRSGLAYWEPGPDGDRLVHYSSCQGAHPTRDILAKTYDLPTDRVARWVPDVGGGFG